MQLKRSQVNRSIKQAIEVFRQFKITLPPFAFWSPDDWKSKGAEVNEIRHCLLGWDVTDFGSGTFDRIGRTLFTLRNGSVIHESYRKPYAEKLILDPEGQRAPAHFHRSKMEDIINRGGGNILVQLTKSDQQGSWSNEDFMVQVDGETVEVGPGTVIRLTPGQSLCIPERTIHQFWGEEGTGLAVSGEVSSVCDDFADNCFMVPAERFPDIEEDEPREFYLCHEYPNAAE